MEGEFAYMSRGAGGIGGQYAGKRGHSMSSYSRNLAEELPRLAEGAWVVDLYDDEREDLREGITVGAVIGAPLCDPTLEGDEERKCPSPDAMLVLADADGGAFGGLAVYASQVPTFRGLDCVSPSALAAYWQAHGGRVGRRVGGEVLWADGERQAIPGPLTCAACGPTEHNTAQARICKACGSVVCWGCIGQYRCGCRACRGEAFRPGQYTACWECPSETCGERQHAFGRCPGLWSR